MLKAWYSKAEVLVHTCTKIYHALKKKNRGPRIDPCRVSVQHGSLPHYTVCHSRNVEVTGGDLSLDYTVLWTQLDRRVKESFLLYFQVCLKSVQLVHCPRSHEKLCSGPKQTRSRPKGRAQICIHVYFFFIKSFHQLSSVWLQIFNNRLVAVL